VKVSEFQRHIAELYLEKDKRRGAEGTLLWLIEEVGEATEAARRNRRLAEDADAPQRVEQEAHLADELADVVAWTASVANLYGVDLEAAIARKYPPTCARCGAKPCACPEPTARPL
jgi:NTP pyrophosphatase (non-canonical NTP hydrolase)